MTSYEYPDTDNRVCRLLNGNLVRYDAMGSSIRDFSHSDNYIVLGYGVIYSINNRLSDSESYGWFFRRVR